MEAGANHIPEEDTVISEEGYSECQRQINAHLGMWTRILKAAENVSSGKIKEADRIRKNLTVQNHNTAPSMPYGKTTKRATTRLKALPPDPFVLPTRHTTADCHTWCATFSNPYGGATNTHVRVLRTCLQQSHR